MSTKYYRQNVSAITVCQNIMNQKCLDVYATIIDKQLKWGELFFGINNFRYVKILLIGFL